MIWGACIFLTVLGAVQIGICEENISSQEMQGYLVQREEAKLSNQRVSFSQEILLTDKEVQVGQYLDKLKKELVGLYQGSSHLNSMEDFLWARRKIEDNSLYAFLKAMPKGGLLHVHSASLLDSRWLIAELATLPHCYVYVKEDGDYLQGTLRFFEEGAAPNGFCLVAKMKEEYPDFDQLLLSWLETETKGKSSSNRWEKFEGWFTKTKGLIHYRPAFIKYYHHAIETLIEDRLQYMELRAFNAPIYLLDGSKESSVETIATFLQIKTDVQKKHPFFDFKIIHSEFRNSPKEKSLDQLELAYFLRSLYPNFVIGYDLVGEEDTGRTTLDHVETFLQAKAFEGKYGVDLPYYFHDGESSSAYNQNLYDAVLLETKRIGHGLNLFHYPYLMERIKEEGICVEICPISNQVLGYVPDLRMHPGALYLKAGLPCVLSSDDPGLFGYTGMSPDLWEAVMAWNLDLRDLKQLCINSLRYSGMSLEEKGRSLRLWEERWEAFIEAASVCSESL